MLILNPHAYLEHAGISTKHYTFLNWIKACLVLQHIRSHFLNLFSSGFQYFISFRKRTNFISPTKRTDPWSTPFSNFQRPYSCNFEQILRWNNSIYETILLPFLCFDWFWLLDWSISKKALISNSLSLINAVIYKTNTTQRRLSSKSIYILKAHYTAKHHIQLAKAKQRKRINFVKSDRNKKAKINSSLWETNKWKEHI